MQTIEGDAAHAVVPEDFVRPFGELDFKAELEKLQVKLPCRLGQFFEESVGIGHPPPWMAHGWPH